MAGKVEHVVRLRVRIRFCKQGDLRLIGHRDLMRCLERVFRRAGLTLSFSEGFHPKPRMTFPLALAVGIEGVDEVMEIELAERYEAEELLRRLAPQAPPGLAFRAIEILPDSGKKAQVQSVSYEAPIPAADGMERADQASAGRRVVADERHGARRSTCARSSWSWRARRGAGDAAARARPRTPAHATCWPPWVGRPRTAGSLPPPHRRGGPA